MNLTPEQIMNLPMSHVFQFAHCALLSAGVPTRWVNRMPDEQAQFDAAMAALRTRAAEKTEKGIFEK